MKADRRGRVRFVLGPANVNLRGAVELKVGNRVLVGQLIRVRRGDSVTVELKLPNRFGHRRWRATTLVVTLVDAKGVARQTSTPVRITR